MKKSQLRKIIKEEIRSVLKESINEGSLFKLKKGLTVKIKPASEIKKYKFHKDYMKYNLQIADKTVEIERAQRPPGGGPLSQFQVKGYKPYILGQGFDDLIIDKIVKESVNEGPGEGVRGSKLIFSPLEDDTIDEWRNDPQIKKWEEEGRVAIHMLTYDSWEIWGVEGDKEVEDYVMRKYAW